jgi:CheY-like chemotaxis protein
MTYRLLLADDDAALREVVREVCAPFFDVLEAESGDEAWELVQSRPDLALCDLHMPGRSGLEALSALKALDARRPAVLMTSRPTEALVDEVRAGRIDSLLPKPFSRQSLLRTLAAAVQAAYDDREFVRRWSL